MKPMIILFVALFLMLDQATAQEKQAQHLLDGSSMDYYYQNGSGVHAEFADGQFKYKWIAGPNAGTAGQENYRSRKIGNRMYLVNFMVESNHTFVTIVFNFNENVVSTSAVIAPGTDQELILFDGGIIEHLILKEK